MGNFIAFTLILFIIAALLQIDFFFSIFYLLIGVYITSRFWSRRVLKNLKVTRTLPTRAFQGEELAVTLTLKNKSRMPVPWLLINDSFSTVLSSPPFFREVITLDSRGSRTLQYRLSARRRGYYPIGPMQLDTGDLLGINRGIRGNIEANHLIVYPKILPIAHLKLPTHSPQVILPTPVPLFKDTTRIIGVKRYVHGDNPRHIHWPATATQNQVLVKKFETAIARETAIFLNMNRTDYGRSGQANVATELAIVVAASVANHTITVEDLPAGLISTGFDPLTKKEQTFRLAPERGRGHLMQILEILARVEMVETSEDDNFLARVQQQAVHLSWGTTIVIVTCTASEALISNILRLKQAGFQVTVVLVQPAAYSYPAEAAVSLPGLGIPTIRIKREKDIEAWQPIL